MKGLEQLKWEYLSLPEDVSAEERYRQIKDLITGVPDDVLVQFSQWMREYRDSFKQRIMN